MEALDILVRKGNHGADDKLLKMTITDVTMHPASEVPAGGDDPGASGKTELRSVDHDQSVHHPIELRIEHGGDAAAAEGRVRSLPCMGLSRSITNKFLMPRSARPRSAFGSAEHSFIDPSQARRILGRARFDGREGTDAVDMHRVFSWKGVVERNARDFDTIIELLCSLARIGRSRPFVPTLPRRRHTRIMSILRPAEFALRRLIAIASRTVTVDVKTGGNAAPGKQNAARPTPVRRSRDGNSDLGEVAIPAFRLFDPPKRYARFFLGEREYEARCIRNARGTKPPSITLPPDEPVDARALCLRIQSLRNAFEHIDAQAKRLARWRARDPEKRRPKCQSPIRIGRPPGYLDKPKSDIAVLLKECHLLAIEAWAEAPDSS